MKLVEIEILENAKIIKNDFYDYDPETDFSEKYNCLYLYEDLLQIVFEKIKKTVDLGWYSENGGVFKLYVIYNSDWDNPEKTIVSKSQKGIEVKLKEIIKELNLASA